MVATMPNDKEKRIAGIEISPEMIAAGVSEYLTFDSRFSNERDLVAWIYEAMERIRRDPPSP